MTEQEQKANAQMVARKAAAFDWLARDARYVTHHERRNGPPFCVWTTGVHPAAAGHTPLEAVEAAMESEAQHDPR